MSEWPRSKFPVSAVRQRRNFGHRNRIIGPYGEHCMKCGVRRDTWVPPYITLFCRAGPVCPAVGAGKNPAGPSGTPPPTKAQQEVQWAGDRKGRPYESVTRGAGESGIPQSRLCRDSPL